MLAMLAAPIGRPGPRMETVVVERAAHVPFSDETRSSCWHEAMCVAANCTFVAAPGFYCGVERDTQRQLWTHMARIPRLSSRIGDVRDACSTTLVSPERSKKFHGILYPVLGLPFVWLCQQISAGPCEPPPAPRIWGSLENCQKKKREAEQMEGAGALGSCSAASWLPLARAAGRVETPAACRRGEVTMRVVRPLR